MVGSQLNDGGKGGNEGRKEVVGREKRKKEGRKER